jgi:hypothetical protein
MDGFKNLFGINHKTAKITVIPQSAPEPQTDKHDTKELSNKSKTYGLFENKVNTSRTGSFIDPKQSELTPQSARAKTPESTDSIKKIGSAFSGFLTARTKKRTESMKHIAAQEGIDSETLYKGYGFSYEDAMKVKQVKQLFGKFLHEVHNEEQFLFLEEVDKYKSMFKKTDKERYNKAKDIISRFIAVFAENEINLSNSQRKDIVAKFDDCSVTHCYISVFDDLNSDVNMMLKVDSFKRFVQSKLFRDFCDKCDSELFSKFATKYEMIIQSDTPKFEESESLE